MSALLNVKMDVPVVQIRVDGGVIHLVIKNVLEIVRLYASLYVLDHVLHFYNLLRL